MMNLLGSVNNEKIEADVRDNKVKQGSLIKRSRHLKEWKQRWMVLTKTHLYSFSAKGQYKNPTEIIPLQEVETIKSYYKDQYNKPFIFRVESPDVNLHMSAKNNDEKWAWMTAIEKMIERIIHPDTKADAYNLIRETLKMSTAVRMTLQKKQQQRSKQNSQLPANLFKKLNNFIQQTVKFTYQPQPPIRETIAEQTFFKVEKNEKKEREEIKEVQKLDNNEKIGLQQKVDKKQEVKQKIVEKIVQKIVQVPVEKVVYIEKQVKVPQIREKIVQKIVQKIVYKDAPSKTVSTGSLKDLLDDLITNPGENPKPMADFVVYLMTSSLSEYHDVVLSFCLTSKSKRFFAQIFLLMMNEETDEQKLNNYLKFVMILYQNTNEYFYSSDVKVLIDIMIRQMEMNISQFNQYLIMSVFKSMAEKDWWLGLKHRRQQIKAFVKELEAISGPQNQYLAAQLLGKL